MYVTGRFPLLVAIGVVPLVLLSAAGFGAWTVLGGWVLFIALVAAVDVVAAPSPGSLRLARDVPARAKLGDEVITRLQLVNTGERTVRARVRDAWQPTAGASAARLRASVPPRESRTLTIPLLPRRRGELRSEFVTIRVLGP
ncbi:MAG: DUF58 domain-containing protein, partial [Microbacterium gubbeenense]